MRIGVVILILLFSGIAGCADGDGEESPGSKHEWSILQGVEYQHREQIPTAPQFSKVEGYDLLSVPSQDGSKRIWIMLWPKSPPFYKQMPEGNFAVSEDLLLGLLGKRQVSSTTYEALRSHVQHKP